MSANDALSPKHDTLTLHRVKRFDAVGDVARNAEGTYLVTLLDFETTGLDSSVDAPIKIGLTLVQVDAASGRVISTIASHSGYEDPGRAIPAVVTQLTGITDEMVAGTRFDDAKVARYVEAAEFLVAHNAAFDRPFFMGRFPELSRAVWACSLQEIARGDAGYSTRSLDYLAFRCGYFFDAHRASTDAQALACVLDTPLKIGDRTATGFTRLRESINGAPLVLISAVGAPFAVKDQLRDAKFRWNAEDRVWQIQVEAARESEVLRFLRELSQSIRPLVEAVDRAKMYLTT